MAYQQNKFCNDIDLVLPKIDSNAMVILAPYTNDSTTMMTQLQAVPLHQYMKCFDLGFNAINRQPILSLKT